MRKVITQDDLVIGMGSGSFDAPEVPEQFLGYRKERLRVIEGKVVDAAMFNVFYIDALGQKHICDGEGRQELSCSWEDELVLEGGKWRVKQDGDRLKERKNLRRHKVRREVSAFVESRYPMQMQTLLMHAAMVTSDVKKMEKIRSVFDWIKSVYTHQDEIELKIEGKRKREQLEAVSADLAAFEASDPKVSLRDVF